MDDEKLWELQCEGQDAARDEAVSSTELLDLIDDALTNLYARKTEGDAGLNEITDKELTRIYVGSQNAVHELKRRPNR